MTQFAALASPVRKDNDSSCREALALSEHNYSRNIYIDDLIDNFAVDEIDEESVPVDSMEVNVGDSATLSKENTEKDDDTDTASETEEEAAANESEDIFETSQNSAEEELAKENPREENTDTNEPRPAVPAENVATEDQPEGEERNNYRSKLVVTCDPSCSALPRRDCASLLTVAPGLADCLSVF